MSRNRSRIWRGAAGMTATLLAFSVTAASVVSDHRTDIDKFLGTKSSRIVTEEHVDMSNMYTYHSDYANTTELVQAIRDLGERMSEEGSVLLKNNGALPLTKEETGKLTLLGFSSYYPVRGGDIGSSLTENEGTDADTVDMVEAFAAKGFTVNSRVQSLYESLKDSYKSEIQSWGGMITYQNIVAPAIGTPFTSKEPSQAAMEAADSGWKESLKDSNILLVTLARSSGENRDYTPGQAGVDSTQSLNQTDPLGLSDDERDLLREAIAQKDANGGKVIVLLNNASPMEIQELTDNEGIDSILQVGLPGGYGFLGVADVLSGAANPSGHLTDIYAVTNANSPAAANYGNLPWTNANPESYMNSALVQAESIYTGYKYYETRYADTVLGQGNASDPVGSSDGDAWTYQREVTYPFGYGLSYTTFTQTLDGVEVDLEGRKVTARVTVTNTGAVAGKDAVQLYVSLPYTPYDVEHGVEKAAIQLLDYSKTKELAPGASETVVIEADMDYMASWDSTAPNAAGTAGCYILDAGEYYFTVGNGSHEAINNVLAAQGKTIEDGMSAAGDAGLVSSWSLAQMDRETFAFTKNGTAVENQLSDMDLNTYMPGTVTYLTRKDWVGTWPRTYENLTATEEMLDILDNDIYTIATDQDTSSVVWGADNGLTLADLKGVKDKEDERWTLLNDQLLLSEAMIRTGFGGTSTKIIESIQSPEVIQNDGPNGIYSYPLGQYANTDMAGTDLCAIEADDPNFNYKAGVMANETVVAQTFNKELAREFGQEMGNYSLWANLTIWWGIGTNIHRLPYNARNHEYFSEDPILSSYQGAAVIEGAQEYGMIAAPKHLAFNDTEVNRIGVAVFMTEQKARELELRATQATVEKAKALGVMTAFNRVGVTAANAHVGLLQNILHKEWGFYGLMSEDFIMDPGYVHLKEAVLNGVTMSCNTGDNTMEAVSAVYTYWTEENVAKDATLQRALKEAMTMQNYALANSNAMDGLTADSYLVRVRTWYDNLLAGLQAGFGLLTLAALIMYGRSRRKKEE